MLWLQPAAGQEATLKEVGQYYFYTIFKDLASVAYKDANGQPANEDALGYYNAAQSTRTVHVRGGAAIRPGGAEAGWGPVATCE